MGLSTSILRLPIVNIEPEQDQPGNFNPAHFQNFEEEYSPVSDSDSDDSDEEDEEEEEYEPKTLQAKTSDELKYALTIAGRGDTIELLPRIYEGTFHLPKIEGGRPVDTIKIIGSWDAETTQGTAVHCPAGVENAVAFYIDGENWQLHGMQINGFDLAVKLNGHNNSLTSIITNGCKNGFLISEGRIMCRIQSCMVNGIGSGNGIDVRGNHCSVVSCMVKNSGVGITITGPGTELTSCSSKAQRSLVVSEGSRGGSLKSSVFYGPSNFSGSDYSLTSNVATGGITILGSRNHFRFNVFNQVRFVSNDYVDDGGNVFDRVRD